VQEHPNPSPASPTTDPHVRIAALLREALSVLCTDREPVRQLVQRALDLVEQGSLVTGPQRSPVPLAPSGRRALAAQMVDTSGSAITDGMYAAEVLDLLSGVVLRLAGVDDDAARAVLASLWAEQ